MTNTDKMYIPNVNQWTRYYQNVVSGQSNAYVNHMKSGYNKGSQSGSFMIPISNKSYPIRAEKENNFVVRLVSPSEQIVNQAKEEIKIDDESINKTDRKRKYHHSPQSRGGEKKPKKSKKDKTHNPQSYRFLRYPPYQVGVESITYEECRPVSQITAYNPIEFDLCANNGMDYIDLKRSKLYVKLKVKKANGEDLQDGDTVGPVNLFLQSLWSQLDVYIQGQMVTSSNTYYPYKCMMKTLLQYGQDAKSTQLSSSLYLKDRYGHMDEISTNTGLYERRKFISNSKTLEMEGPIFSDIFEMDRYLLNMLSLKLKLYRNDPSLMSGEIDTNYHISLEDVVIKLCKIRPNPAIIVAHSEALKTTNAKYPFTKNYDEKFYNHARKHLVNRRKCFPRCETEKYCARIGFFNCYVTLFCDGIPVDGIPLKLDFNENSGATNVSPYVKMFETRGKWMLDTGNEITRAEFNNGYTLLCFNLEPFFSDTKYLSLLKQGKIRLECQFGTPLPETAALLILAENYGYFEITENRQIKIEH
ncbi:Hypothetical predicted protein [Mytilus galloprovincialis]|uniref:Uncharacterized protein n=1 Tax=Mytilus galloprovincialis TaxID=29158 RepID=A0A8B6GG78_MYTGA|nr:Hypothetical predicted protein [Mytilus galloprovincialis]